MPCQRSWRDSFVPWPGLTVTLVTAGRLGDGRRIGPDYPRAAMFARSSEPILTWELGAGLWTRTPRPKLCPGGFAAHRPGAGEPSGGSSKGAVLSPRSTILEGSRPRRRTSHALPRIAPYLKLHAAPGFKPGTRIVSQVPPSSRKPRRFLLRKTIRTTEPVEPIADPPQLAAIEASSHPQRTNSPAR